MQRCWEKSYAWRRSADRREETLTLNIFDPQHHATIRRVCHTQAGFEGSGMQRVIVDPIPFLVCFAIALLLVWLWRRFRRR
jgi:hypothetical protein